MFWMLALLHAGYQRELNYKHDDGSYSAFGKSDDSGNTWFVPNFLLLFRPDLFLKRNHFTFWTPLILELKTRPEETGGYFFTCKETMNEKE